MRERIASLPPEVSEVQLLSKLEGKMTPHYRIDFVIKLEVHLLRLFLDLQKYKIEINLSMKIVTCFISLV